jgi:hypothetical protein
MKVKIKTKALARRLANNKLIEIYGKDAIWEDTIDEFYGRKYKKEVLSDATRLFEHFLSEIRDHIVYPFKEGDTYYTVIRSGDRYDVQESIWDNISEEVYRKNPHIKLFETESQAYSYVSHIIKKEK